MEVFDGLGVAVADHDQILRQLVALGVARLEVTLEISAQTLDRVAVFVQALEQLENFFELRIGEGLFVFQMYEFDVLLAKRDEDLCQLRVVIDVFL
ncbi:MAG: hypothetical protein ACKOEI_09685, partial [Chthoniobacterales bacterium]